jgi:hypothetical protein
MNIDLNTVREMRANAENMVRHYGNAEQKQRQNEALVAAGLPPLHGDASLQWDIDQGRKYARFVEACDAILAHFGADQAEAA